MTLVISKARGYNTRDKLHKTTLVHTVQYTDIFSSVPLKINCCIGSKLD